MRNKPPVSIRVAPLRLIKAEIVTDPVEIAAMEEMRKRLRKPKRTRGPSKRSSA